MIRKLKKITFGTFMIYFVLGLFSATIVVAFLHLLSISFSPSHIATKGGLHLWPKEFTLKNYPDEFSPSHEQSCGGLLNHRIPIDTLTSPDYNVN